MSNPRRWSSVAGIPLTLAPALILALALPASAARGPVPVSPGGQAAGSEVEARCPTFLWSGVPAASGYEVAVFRVAGDGAEPVLVTRASVPGDARGWTPSSSSCLERGGRYAWSVAVAATGEQLAWSSPFLFDVEAAPSLEELELAIATIERYRTLGMRHGEGDRPVLSDHVHGALSENTSTPHAGTRRPHAAGGVDGSRDGAIRALLPGALVGPTSGVARVAAEANAPTLGTPSLRVGANVALSAASNLFKNDDVFLWDDGEGNTALGRKALASVSGGSTIGNTAVGRGALQNTAAVGYVGDGSSNTAIGDRALRDNSTGYRNTAAGALALFTNTTGDFNTASGFRALVVNTTGSRNTASSTNALRHNTTGSGNTAAGFDALYDNVTGSDNTATGDNALYSTTGSRNTAVGRSAGMSTTTGDDNIHIGSGAYGLAGETHTIRIGGPATGAATPGPGQQNRTFINGIRGITTAAADAINVLISSSTGQLGTASSSRAVKQDIQELGALADRLLELRPVAFRYRQHAEDDPDTPLQFGLIAEEVAEVFPELVVYDEAGQPETVKYHLLSSLLLGELQRQQEEVQRQQEVLQRQHEQAERHHQIVLDQSAKIQRLDARLEAVESQKRPSERSHADSRRRGR